MKKYIKKEKIVKNPIFDLIFINYIKTNKYNNKNYNLKSIMNEILLNKNKKHIFMYEYENKEYESEIFYNKCEYYDEININIHTNKYINIKLFNYETNKMRYLFLKCGYDTYECFYNSKRYSYNIRFHPINMKNTRIMITFNSLPELVMK
jgi:hypothetical protein